MKPRELVVRTPPPPPHGFLVQQHNGGVPAIGEKGISSQTFCPLINGDCKGPRCMFWVELFLTDQRRVAHCAYYWNTVQLTDIKSQLIEANRRLAAASPTEPHADRAPRQ